MLPNITKIRTRRIQVSHALFIKSRKVQAIKGKVPQVRFEFSVSTDGKLFTHCHSTTFIGFKDVALSDEDIINEIKTELFVL